MPAHIGPFSHHEAVPNAPPPCLPSQPHTPGLPATHAAPPVPSPFPPPDPPTHSHVPARLPAAPSLLRQTYPFWQKHGGRDHVFLFTHDEGACWAPTIAKNAVWLTHWGRMGLNHT